METSRRRPGDASAAARGGGASVDVSPFVVKQVFSLIV